MTRAIILAAGEGTRLRPHTADRPKCWVPFAGRPLLVWQCAALRAAAIDDITIVTGYSAATIEAAGYATIRNDRFATTNMVASLMCAGSVLTSGADVLVAYGDLLYEPRVVRALLETTAPRAITIDRRWQRLWSLRMPDPLADAETLKLDGENNVLELGRRPSSLADIEGQYMGLIRLSADAAADAVSAYAALDPNGPYERRSRDQMYMTTFLQHLIDHDRPLRAVAVDGGWLEVDTIEDLATYEALNASGQLAEICDLGELR